MQKWEYGWLTINHKYGQGSMGDQLSSEGTIEHFNDWGRDGWELVNVTSINTAMGTESLIYTFKRPITDELD